MDEMKRILIAATLATLATAGTVNATDDNGCTTVDYQGAPADLCPPPEPDPTNCYTGWYQGSPIEICMPTGESLPEGTVYHDGTPWAGQPILIHNASGYTPPEPELQPAPVEVVEQSPAPVDDGWIDVARSLIDAATAPYR